MADPIGKPSDKADRPERRPGLGLARAWSGKGRKLPQETLLSGALMLPLPHPKLR